MIPALTPKQKDVLDFIIAFIHDKGYPPSFREIASGLELASFASTESAADCIAILLRDGSLPQFTLYPGAGTDNPSLHVTPSDGAMLSFPAGVVIHPSNVISGTCAP